MNKNIYFIFLILLLVTPILCTFTCKYARFYHIYMNYMCISGYKENAYIEGHACIYPNEKTTTYGFLGLHNTTTNITDTIFGSTTYGTMGIESISKYIYNFTEITAVFKLTNLTGGEFELTYFNTILINKNRQYNSDLKQTGKEVLN
ncbi:hypothetical protein PPL_07431 [Heterostelium album PN500]|uniref:Uncharacterized protein n=1 Tax=Heterostelium pallidum (strain ATCC 26659 / Pp 5 / PN500) TaxID=670386 RepID=D3BFY0_HETP5|nr:hypothetical protein PPL_07431 [Heterostelium album PN500]EFA79740.1 hypothetical protein PPL_07431 [Heterostelium album PN500]|eukprot:XP_020431861.1 hypothetical protein PPL_07431 [Heterostelium album PN500]